MLHLGLWGRMQSGPLGSRRGAQAGGLSGLRGHVCSQHRPCSETCGLLRAGQPSTAPAHPDLDRAGGLGYASPLPTLQ